MKSDLSGAKLGKAKLRRAVLLEAKLNRALFDEGDLRETILQHVQALEARFIKTRMGYADLSWAVLDRADFSGADLSGSILHAIHEDGTIWKSATTTRAKRTEMVLLEAETFKPKKK